MNNLIESYQNGNCSVKLFDDGTKIREWEGNANPIFPDSIDLKITNYCDNPICIAHCHEESNKKGIHCDTDYLLNLLNEFQKGTEIAIGGGNPLSHPDLDKILCHMRSIGIIPNITVNAYHISDSFDRINYFRKEKMIFGLGISYLPDYEAVIRDAWDNNTVLHVIAGVHNVNHVMKLPKDWKMLILGYKQHGYGKKYYQLRPVEDILSSWKYWIGTFMRNFHVSFDNLAIKQLNIQDWILPEKWNQMYMGDDGQFTMYIDAVKEEFAVSSTSVERKHTEDMDISQMFEIVRNTQKN